MKEKEINEIYLQRGQFQRAVQFYEGIGDNDNYVKACLACAQDCLEVGLYERAVEYFEYGERKEIADELKRIFKDNKSIIKRTYSHSPSRIERKQGADFYVGLIVHRGEFYDVYHPDMMVMRIDETKPTLIGSGCHTHYGCSANNNLENFVNDFVGTERENFLKFVAYLQEQDFIGQAEELKNEK